MTHTSDSLKITVASDINAPVDKVWKTWTEPEHIVNWCFASDDWHAPLAENNLQVNGEFKTRMAAKDGSFEFDFGGKYTKVILHECIEYVMEDGREVQIKFTSDGNVTNVLESFDPEDQNPRELQQQGWQSILDNFKKYTELL